jgi:hypothetical protein
MKYCLWELSILYKVLAPRNGLALKGFMPLLHTRGPETFTSVDVGSCFNIKASGVFILTSQALNNIYYVNTDHGALRYIYN